MVPFGIITARAGLAEVYPGGSYLLIVKLEFFNIQVDAKLVWVHIKSGKVE